jgi:hypothetical protein
MGTKIFNICVSIALTLTIASQLFININLRSRISALEEKNVKYEELFDIQSELATHVANYSKKSTSIIVDLNNRIKVLEGLSNENR